MVISDDIATAEEQIKQILAVAPILHHDHNSIYEIPGYHAKCSTPANVTPTPATTEKPEPARSETGTTADLIDFTPDTNLRDTPALVPTSAGVAPAGKLGQSGLESMADVEKALPATSGAAPVAGTTSKAAKRESYASSDDDFVDAQ